MDRQSEGAGLRAAWRALAGGDQTEGWRTISVASPGTCRIVAGRRFPENEESLLIGFSTAVVPPTDQLPRGRGFHVSRADVTATGLQGSWIAVSKKATGSLDLFELMAEDLVGSVSAQQGRDEQRALQFVLARIRAWQDFMQREGDGVLSAEAELGLMGELHVLSQVLDAASDLYAAVDAWKGPLGGLQDFSIGQGAMEVKATAAPVGFPARIGSLMQLDDSLVRPLFLVGVRLAVAAGGRTLPESIAAIKEALKDEPVALRLFETRLLHAGYLESAREHYVRRFSIDEVIALRVAETTPRLTRANVPAAISDALYELDLSLISEGRTTLTDTLAVLGGR